MNITRKELETKAAKTFRKANRLKATALKIEKLNEFLEVLRTLQADESSLSSDSAPAPRLVQAYRDLCFIQKLKFQLDALFDGIRTDMKQLAKISDQLTQVQFDFLVRRLTLVMEIDNQYPEANQLLIALQQEFPQFAAHSSVGNLALDLTPYQRQHLIIEMTCRLTDLTQNSRLGSLYTTYQRPPSETAAMSDLPGKTRVSLRFTQKQLSEFGVFHEELRTKPGYALVVNAHPVDEGVFSEWFQCYQRFLKAQTPQYCYGASPFTFNVFGCHKLRLPDVAKSLDRCWFHYGTLDQDSSLFLLDLNAIAAHIRSQLPHCGFCPALTQEKLLIGLGVLPRYINPECDPRWEYCFQDEHSACVLPRGDEIAIALRPDAFSSQMDPAAFLEVGSSPYIEKVLKYLEAHETRTLAESAYRNLSHCLHCGAHYKLHTMTCSQCKMQFWKLALKDPEATREHLQYRRKPDLKLLQQAMLDSSPAASHQQAQRARQDKVSFDQLWSDPEVRKILSSKEERPSEEIATASDETMSEPEHVPDESGDHAASFSAQSSSGRFDLHGKLRSLLSQKYRERKAIEDAFSQTSDPIPPPARAQESPHTPPPLSEQISTGKARQAPRAQEPPSASAPPEQDPPPLSPQQAELLDALKKLKPRKKSELSKRGVVRVIYHATMDKETCPLCAYLDGMVMDPDDPATDIFSPPLFPGCTCRREYVLKTEKPHKWPAVTFIFPPEELLTYLQKKF